LYVIFILQNNYAKFERGKNQYEKKHTPKPKMTKDRREERRKRRKRVIDRQQETEKPTKVTKNENKNTKKKTRLENDVV